MSNDWIIDIYNQTQTEWIKNGQDGNGYAIFYSPVIENPEIMIIGYNPGGDKSSFNRDITMRPPSKHEYVDGKYKLAEKMRAVFRYAGLINELENTVKLNLIFFRSENASDIKNKEIINFCADKVKTIIEKLNPKILLIEGFGTYNEILKLLNLRKSAKSEEKAKSVINCTVAGNVTIIGLRHPSGSWGVSEAMLKQMGDYLGKQYRRIV